MSLGNDRTGVEILDADECHVLLRRGTIGRVAFAVAGEIDVLPVNYAMDGYSVVFRTAAGEKLGAALMEQAVAFEIDELYPASRSGWSVLVKGTAEPVDDQSSLERLGSLGLEPWAGPDQRDHWVRIRPFEITGRRVGEGVHRERDCVAP
jgi:nitroimidazol reductase NimA-like FMN-containing flavoprotein (pyridoxamine 5'-phosphate oxidase superfamily)